MRPGKAAPCKPVVSVFSPDPSLISSTLSGLSERFGPVDMVSGLLAFDSTDYYREEFGGGLKRKLASFERLLEPETLPAMKHVAASLEGASTIGGKRRVNIDPGYLTLERLVLSSFKNFTHRIYIGMGVYADLTLIYTGKAWQDLAWTYPDYRTREIKGFLTEARRRYRLNMAAEGEIG